MIFRFIFLSIFQCLSLSGQPLSDSTGTQQRHCPLIVMEFPVFDYPFNTENGFSFSSMNEAISITNGVTQGAHHLMKIIWSPDLSDKDFGSLFSNRRFAGFCISVTLFDIFSPFKGWTHEEGHRAVLSRRGISSQNDIYLNPFAEMVSVSHVRDEDLVRLKDEFPEDMVRLAEAGGEVQIELSMQMRKQNFFGARSTIYDLADIWINLGNLAWYIWLCGSDEADRIISEETMKEDTDIMKRDIIGGDYLSWVYDLYRPDEPYLLGLRGRPHPSGTGIDRYIMPSELSDEELNYLRLQSRLILLNFISPQLFGIDRFTGTNPFNKENISWNFALTHHLTSFGTATGFHFFYQHGKSNIVISFQGYASKRKIWPGFSMELYRYPFCFRGRLFSLSSNASLWLQPTGQRFLSDRAQAGGSVMLGVFCPVTGQFEIFAECDIKSEGWIAGNVYLEPAFQARTGFCFTVK